MVRVVRIHEDEEVLTREHVRRGVIRDDLVDPRLDVRRATRNGIRAGVLDDRAELVGAVRADKDDDAVLILPLCTAPTLMLHIRECDERPTTCTMPATAKTNALSMSGPLITASVN